MLLQSAPPCHSARSGSQTNSHETRFAPGRDRPVSQSQKQRRLFISRGHVSPGPLFSLPAPADTSLMRLIFFLRIWCLSKVLTPGVMNKTHGKRYLNRFQIHKSRAMLSAGIEDNETSLSVVLGVGPGHIERFCCRKAGVAVKRGGSSCSLSVTLGKTHLDPQWTSDLEYHRSIHHDIFFQKWPCLTSPHAEQLQSYARTTLDQLSQEADSNKKRFPH